MLPRHYPIFFHNLVWMLFSPCGEQEPEKSARDLQILRLFCPNVERWLDAHHLASSRKNYRVGRSLLRLLFRYADFSLLESRADGLSELRKLTKRLKGLNLCVEGA